MTFERTNMGWFIAFVLIGGIIGAALGAFIVKLVPALAVITSDLTGPVGINLQMLQIAVRLNVSAIAGIIAGIFIFWKI
jgi:hypothetical protein